MIRIGAPRLETSGDELIRLVSDIWVDNEKRTVWAEVSVRYKDYLCYERSDAFVVGLLHYAMLHNHDIVCDAPMGEYLYYQITTFLVDAVSKGSPRMHSIRLDSPVDSKPLPCAGKVGTGISCGIDSLHVLACQSGTVLKRHNVTHLAFYNVGSHGEGERARQLFFERRRLVLDFCKEYGFELTEVNSNIMDEFEQNHYLTHTFTSMFAVFCLQKLYSIYYYASGRQISAFSLADTSRDCSYYDLLLADVFSTDTLKVYSEGGTSTRLEKTRKVAEYVPSYKYLNVCVSTLKNCGTCEKCVRTLLAIDSLGKLDCYKAVFDINYYRKNKEWYLISLLARMSTGNEIYKELYPYFKSEITIKTRVKAIPLTCKIQLTHLLRNSHPNILRFLKRIFH